MTDLEQAARDTVLECGPNAPVPPRGLIHNVGNICLRDHIAMAALQGPVAATCLKYSAQELASIGGLEWMAERAYAIADAMLAEREKGHD